MLARELVESSEWRDNWIVSQWEKHLEDTHLPNGLRHFLHPFLIYGDSPHELVLRYIGPNNFDYLALCNTQDSRGYITRLYNTILGRQPTSSEMNRHLKYNP
ncbi:hypothetical protein CHISP_2419 [Chitinispirillum alkaliphilum]|nr:hypothetical protein CHISP_2419 [Chitinispirillum alkaliphilum]